MWGLPRVFSAAVALALLATTHARATPQAFRAHNSLVLPVDLTTREGLVEHLSALETAPHPGAAIKSFLETLAPAGALAERVLITHSDTLADPDFKRALSAHPDLDCHAACVDREGNFHFLHLTSRGQTTLREARLDLHKIMSSDSHAAPLRIDALDPSLPAILAVKPFPLRVPHKIDPARTYYSEKHGLFALTMDGRLTQFTTPQHGPLLLSDTVPRANLIRLFVHEEAEITALLHNASTNDLLLYRVDTASRNAATRVLLSAKAAPRNAHVHRGALLVFYENEAHAYNLATGMPLDQRSFPTGAMPHGRYFTSRGKWFVVDASSHRMDFRETKILPSHWIALIDREGLDGPWGLHPNGTLSSSANASVVRFDLPESVARVLRVSHDGHRIAVQLYGAPKFNYLLDAERQTAEPITVPLQEALEPRVRPFIQGARAVRTKVPRVGISPDGAIVIFSRKNFPFAIQLSDGKLVIAPYPRETVMPSSTLGFKPIASPPGVRYELGAARFKDGSRIILDSRGLFHMDSAWADVPDITLVLHDLRVAGWCADAEQCGSNYFIASGRTVDDAVFYKKILRFTEKLR